MNKKSLSTQFIIDQIMIGYGIGVATLTSLPFGADMNAYVYKAKSKRGVSYFVKVKIGTFSDVSHALLGMLQASGIQQIIPPIKTIEGELNRRLQDFTLTLYPFIEGENGFCSDLSDDQWVALGEVLKQIHQFKVPASIKDQIRKELYSSKWRDAVRSIYNYVDGDIFEDEIASKLQAFMKKKRAVIHRLVDRAEFLCRKSQELSAEFVLCHGDIHAGNVLIDGKGAIFIVDWDDPVMAPKERDLMFIGGGVANVWNDLREEELFYRGYGGVQINRIILAYYRHERIVEDIALYAEALLLTKDNQKERLEMYKQFTDMFEMNGVVDIAFKTDS